MKSPTITIKIPSDLRLRFRIAALKNGTTMTEVLLKTIKKYLKKNEK